MTEPAAPIERTEPTLDSTTRADQSDELATTTMLRGAIGPINTDYYLKLFTRFDAQDRAGVSWNTAAAVATLNWMLFRQMWNAALAYTGIALTLALLIFGIGKLAFHYPPEVQWALGGVYLVLLVGIPGLWGNAWLFRQLRSSMAGALSANQSIADAAAMLLARAPTRKRLLVLTVLNVLLGGLVLALALWAKDFQGMAGSPTPADPMATAPAPIASGNVAIGQAMEAASAPAAVASAAATPASTPASATLPAPTSPALATSAPGAAASAPGSVASAPAPATKASAPAAVASSPASSPIQAPASAKGAAAPQAKASSVTAPASAPATAAKKEPTTSAPQNKPPSPATAGRAPAAPVPSTAEKTEAAKLAPQSTAQQARKAAAPVANKAPAPKPSSTAVSAFGDQPGVQPGQYGINVGLFADPNNARNAFIKLSDVGLPVYTQAVQGKKGQFTRVRVGPYESLAEAERSASRIRTLGLDALVFQQAAASR